jgi:AraC-like DNA-binding protein
MSPVAHPSAVGEIAYACGFNEVSYFNRRFRRRFGVSPTQYRANGHAP